MINTIEICPPIIAAGLAKHLVASINNYCYYHEYGFKMDEQKLCKLIKNYLIEEQVDDTEVRHNTSYGPSGDYF